MRFFKPLLPTQRTFLHYVLYHKKSAIQYHTDKIKTILQNNGYLEWNGDRDVLNIIRYLYIDDYFKYVKQLSNKWE